MPFLELDNNWSKLAPLYNQNFNGKPEVPRKIEQFTSFDDGLVRGGLYNAALSTVKDVVRIGKFFISGKGALFIIKQVGLQLTNPQLESKYNTTPTNTANKTQVGAIISKVTDYVKANPTKVYNLGINTLAQVGVQAAGLHIVRHGLLPKFESDYNYEKIAIENNTAQGSRMSVIPAQKFLTDDQTGTLQTGNSNRLVNYLSILNLDSKGPIALQSYTGGPSSVYGLTKTVIKTTNVRTTINDNDLAESVSVTQNKIVATLSQFGIPMTSTQPTSFSIPAANQTLFTRLNGFKPLTNGAIQLAEKANLDSLLKPQLEKSPLAANQNISSNNIEARVGVSRGGRDTRKVDSINAINIVKDKYYYSTLGAGGTNPSNSPDAFKPPKSSDGVNSAYNSNVKNNVDGYFGRDLARLILEFIDNDSSSPSTDVLVFRAYIDDLNDGMNAKWTSYRYMGRGEDFYVYDGFSRDISVAFTIYAHTPEEMRPLYQKLNYLMSTFAPDYSDRGKMRGNIGYLTVGDYISKQPGIFTDIKISGLLDTHWEIGFNPQGGLPQNVVPKLLKVSLSFKPIHTKLPRKVKYNNPFLSNFILPPSGDKNYYSTVG